MGKAEFIYFRDSVSLYRAQEEMIACKDMQFGPDAAFAYLLCPEDMSQMNLEKEQIYDPLPEDVKSFVVWRKDFWLPDEALAVYKRSFGLFGNEMHSPIMCIGNGIPALTCRYKEITTKGYMWKDIGLGEWLFNLDVEDEVLSIPYAVRRMLTESEKSLRMAASAMGFVEEKYKEMSAKLQRYI